MGIIYLMPFLQDLLRKIPTTLQLRSVLAMTLSAQVFTLPLLIYNFGYISIASLVANILIVPLLPFVMISGFIFALLGLISSFLGWIFSFVSWFLLSYILKVVEIFSSFPIIQIKISWAWLIFCYLVLSFIAWRVNKKEMVFR